MYPFFKFYLNLHNHHFQQTLKSLNLSHQFVNPFPNKANIIIKLTIEIISRILEQFELEFTKFMKNQSNYMKKRNSIYQPQNYDNRRYLRVNKFRLFKQKIYLNQKNQKLQLNKVQLNI
ncbi:unnamed protein product [Paramecium sonneborni]|uniref:Uncharacterized protein n=1 Tax=Paramecium sonneborni TaxID=65129 RepID=A0A8S1RPB6_9CILI|nr:unnamed protein product [Paramecium sonneborni]